MSRKALLLNPFTRTIAELTWSAADLTDAAPLVGAEWIETLSFDDKHLLVFDEEGLLKNQVVRDGELNAQSYFVAMTGGELVLLAGCALVVGIGANGKVADCTVNEQQLRGRVSFVRNTLAAWRLSQSLVMPIMVDDTPQGRLELQKKLLERQARIRELVAREPA